jgi:sugar phosphate isomerase/epimerase
MKLATCAYSYRDLLKDGQMTLEAFMDLAVEIGFDGIEWTSYYFPETTKSYMTRVKREAFFRGLGAAGAATGGNFANAEADKRAAQIENVKDWLVKATWLGAPVLRVFAGGCPEGVNLSEAQKWVADGIAACLPTAEEEGVVMALENHGGMTADAAGTLALIEPFKDNPYVRLNLDFGNFRDDVYGQYEACAPYAATTHVKPMVRVGEERVPVDYRRVMKIMAETGYNGYYSIEYEEKEPAIPYCERFASYLRGCMVDG